MYPITSVQSVTSWHSLVYAGSGLLEQKENLTSPQAKEPQRVGKRQKRRPIAIENTGILEQLLGDHEELPR